MTEAPDAQGDAADGDDPDADPDADPDVGPDPGTGGDPDVNSDGDPDVDTGGDPDENSDGESDVDPVPSPEADASGDADVESLRRQVEEKYDFDDFGPADMAEMSAEEWDAAFDPDTWITGAELLDRVEADLKRRVADRDVFARVERHGDRVLAYSDTGYAVVYDDGSVEGSGTVLRDVKPTVALCSMESYDVPEEPPEDLLPEPQEVPEGSGTLGNWMLQAVAAVQVVAGVVLFGAWLLVGLGIVSTPGGGSIRSLNVVGMLVAGVLFLGIGVLLFTVVANARLSDRFRAEEYRNRLRAVELDPGERPEFLPDGDDRPEDTGRAGRDPPGRSDDATSGDT